jgi:glycosyltransferase involved in cell wall biosynthesis
MSNVNGKCSIRKLKIMVSTSDRYPPIRPAAKAIFGEELVRRGHRIDWLMQSADAERNGGQFNFGSGLVFLAPTEEGTTRLHRLAARINGSKFCYWLAYPHAEANIYAATHGLARYPLFYRFRGWYQSFLLYKVLLPRADHIFVQSEKMRADIAAKGIDCELMTPVQGSLNLKSVPYQKDNDPGPDGPTILYVGTLIRIRKLDFVIRVFAKVLRQVPDARLLIVGKGESPEDEELLRREVLTQKIDPSHVEFVGHVPASEVWKYIERSAVCLSPYYPVFELISTSPTKLIEYMAMARPVVANEHPEQSLIISESEAGFCLPWDETDFANGIVSLLRDSRKAAEMGHKGRRWVECNRTHSRMADVVEAGYLSLLDSEASGRRGRSEPSGNA